VLGPSRGAFLTFASRGEGLETAPGQLTAREMRETYRVDSADGETLITGVVGWPVTHSLSPHMHNAAFAALGMNAAYIPFAVRDLGAFMRRMVDERTRELGWRLRGLSVTAPHKRAVMEHLSWVEPKAREIGAVNTVVVEAAGLRGYNTDASASLVEVRELIICVERAWP
jgi:3-dehydroquinate dehydratase/shikimate dehydrogenase